MVPQEQDRRHAPIFEVPLSTLELFEEALARQVFAVTCQCLELFLLVAVAFLELLLALLELLLGDGVAFAVEGQLDQLARELLVLQVEEVLVADLVVKVLLIGVELFDLGVLEVSVEVVVHTKFKF